MLWVKLLLFIVKTPASPISTVVNVAAFTDELVANRVSEIIAVNVMPL
jgi:hypothetical protein